MSRLYLSLCYSATSNLLEAYTQITIIQMIEQFAMGFRRFSQLGCALALGVFTLVSVPVCACTVFILTDSTRVLFCNNEDWTNPRSRIWFIPSSSGRNGCVYVGFDDNQAQGGLNTQGLAYDWVAGCQEAWGCDPKLEPIRGNGNSSQQMLETCSTVEDAIAFYKTHQEGSFSRAKILVADSTGASVIIGAQNGQLDVQRDNVCRGFGYGEHALAKSLPSPPEASVANGFKILRESLQKGATRYSNIYDLRSGEISLFPFQDRDDQVDLNLADELKKAEHYYDLLQIQQQLKEPARPLLSNMKRRLLEDFAPIPDNQPEMAKRIRSFTRDAASGSVRPADYSAEFWKAASSDSKKIQASLKETGDLTSLTLVEHSMEDKQSSYRYRMEFEYATLLQHFAFDDQGRLASSGSEDTIWKPGAPRKLDWKPPTNAAGLGLRLSQPQESQSLTVLGVIPASPSQKAGIKEGSLLLSIDDTATSSITLQQAVGLIRGESGTMVKLQIAEPVSQKTKTFTLKRQVTQSKIGVSQARDQGGI